MTIRPRRSVLYMPGSNARALEKARSLAADALILDLEDAVAPDAKDIARTQVCEAVKAGGYGRREILIRINGLNTAHGAADLASACAAGPDAILVPKVESAEEVQDIGRRMNALGAPASTALWVMIETPRAILDVASIAAAKNTPDGARLAGFVMGTNDLAKDTRARLIPGRAPFLTMLSLALLAARNAGLEIIDGVYNNLKDLDGFRLECEQGRDFGMDGKTLIHPDQLAIANEVFAPSVAEIEQARKVIAVFDLPENRTAGALQVEGRMVERLHADMARRTVAVADAINS
jgi:citrate lyase subunit beta/citryl-CoA lyase